MAGRNNDGGCTGKRAGLEPAFRLEVVSANGSACLGASHSTSPLQCTPSKKSPPKPGRIVCYSRWRGISPLCRLEKADITHSPGGTVLGRFAALYTHAKNFKTCFGVCFRAHAAVVICPTCRCGCLNRHRVPMSLDPRITSLPSLKPAHALRVPG